MQKVSVSDLRIAVLDTLPKFPEQMFMHIDYYSRNRKFFKAMRYFADGSSLAESVSKIGLSRKSSASSLRSFCELYLRNANFTYLSRGGNGK